MIVQVSIDKVPEEGESEEELEGLYPGVGQTVAAFDFDPTKENRWKYLLDLQETLFQMMRHEMAKAKKEYEDNG